MLEVGDSAPQFTVLDDSGNPFVLSDLKGKQVVLYFYPKDDTPGCTREACDFRDNIAAFKKQGAVILGVSKDSERAHQKFKDKYDLTFPLLVDEAGKLCEAYGVLGEKSMFGKKYQGVNRITFLIDEKGIIKKIWHKVKVDGHVAEVLKSLS